MTWVNVSLGVAEGDYKIEFTYKKDSSGDHGDDKGYVMMHDIGELCDYTYTAPIPKLDIGELFDIIDFTGINFNEAAKKLVSSTSDITYESTNTSITKIKRIYDYDEFPKTRAAALYNSENDSYLLMSVKGTTSSWYNDIIYLYSDDDIVMLPKDCSYMFYEMKKLSTLNIEYFNANLTENMSYMFAYIDGLTSINLGEHFDTSNVTNMSRMFSNTFIYCASDFSFLGDKFNTSNVTDMSGMFLNFNLKHDVYKEITLNFDTSNATDTSWMFFSFCTPNISANHYSLNLGDNFDTSKVTDMSYMFAYTQNCVELNLGNKFDTSNVTNMSSMFTYTLARYDKTEEFIFNVDFNTSNVTNMSDMFCGFCIGNSIEKLTLNLGNNFDTSNVINMAGMFQQVGAGVANSVELNLGDKFNTSNVTNMSNMFLYYATTATTCSLNLGDKFDTTNVVSFRKMFQECGTNGLTELDLGAKFNRYSATVNSYAMEKCGKPPCTVYGTQSIISYFGNAYDTNRTYSYQNEDGTYTTAYWHNYVVKYT